ncbi:cobyric acid synthase [Pelagicoccus mobilis]|uniref:Cobyric acid synthase n=1 Tax=Pelagicoccus mobilis TaxID=415221 RepID=A0A934RVV5_9BACT|nr:cobyric acid synthase [Pelagicoccus mobilis]MBK1878680.1 cobyric acid synthase [Pelagicoccus mobilis]
MKTISLLGTSSNAGKSWMATAVCAWLRKQGVKVAPFKAQNMANNAFATLTGGEIGVAQAVQAEACGLIPAVEMNPILLKPNGANGSQIVRLGVAGETVLARDYYETIEESWGIVAETLDRWRGECDVLVMEGAGSPVELNLMSRDIVNLRPIEYTDGRWVLVSNIEYGGVFAQVFGTWGLLPSAMQRRGLGAIVNRFRGDLSLFDGARNEFEERMELPYLGCLPFDSTLGIDDEDSLNSVVRLPAKDRPYVAWVKYPQVANSQDMQPWLQDKGIQNIWTVDPEVVRGAAAIVLPGTKNTLSDLAWLRERGLGRAVIEVASKGVTVVGICGGKQMLGRRLFDPVSKETADGLGLLPFDTEFCEAKQVVRNESVLADERWETFEIHTGQSRLNEGAEFESLFEAGPMGSGKLKSDGLKVGKVWGSYQHGLFDSPSVRERLLEEAGIGGVVVSRADWRSKRLGVYDSMAESIESHLDLEPVRRYLGL